MSARTTLTAVAGGALFSLSGLYVHADAGAALRLAVCGGVLAAAAVVDLNERRIPNRLTMPAVLILAALAAANRTPISTLADGLAFASALLLIALLAPAAIGMGDAKLALVIALSLPGQAPLALAVAVLLAAAFVAAGMVAGSLGRTSAVPLAPFFALGGFVALLT